MKTIAIVAALLSAAPVQADTVTAYDFDANVQGWFANNFSGLMASVTYDATDGSPAAGSLILQAAGSLVGIVRSPCLAIPAGTTSIRVSLMSESQQQIPLIIDTFPVNCDSYDGAYSYDVNGPLPATTWTSFDATTTVDVSDKTAFAIELQPRLGDIVHVDHVILATHGSTPIRLQSFGVD